MSAKLSSIRATRVGWRVVHNCKPVVKETERTMLMIRSKLAREAFADHFAAGKALTVSQVENLVLSL